MAELGYVPAIADSPSVVLVGVADPSKARRERVAAAAGVPAFASLSELIEAGGVDAVVVAASTDAHADEAAVAAGAGIPSLVEKPPAPDLAGAERMAALDPAPWIGFNRRFQQGVELGPSIPAEGPLALELELTYRRSSWRAHEERRDALSDLGPHLIDLALLICGGRTPEVAGARVAERRAEIELVLDRGTARIRCATDRPHRERVVVRGPDGRRLAASSIGGPVAALRAWVHRDDHPLVASLRRQLEAFARAVRGADPGPLADAADGVAVMRVIDAAAGRSQAASR